jgi:hypothetical protein
VLTYLGYVCAKNFVETSQATASAVR